MLSRNLTPTLSSELRFLCSSLTVTTEKANACGPWTSCYFCMKRITLFNCQCSCTASLIRDIRDLIAKNYFTYYRTANAAPLFVHVKRKFFRFILFQNKSQGSGILQLITQPPVYLHVIKIDIK